MEYNYLKDAEKCMNHYEFTLNDLNKKKQLLEKLEEKSIILKDSFILAKKCSIKFLDQLTTIEALVSQGLSSILETPFKFRFEKVYGPQESLKGLRPIVETDSGHIENPITGQGSSVIQIICVVLRLCVLAICGGTKPLLILDEAFSNINSSLRRNLESFIADIAHNSNIQVITVTHMDSENSVIYEIENVGGISQIQKVTTT